MDGLFTELCQFVSSLDGAGKQESRSVLALDRLLLPLRGPHEPAAERGTERAVQALRPSGQSCG